MITDFWCQLTPFHIIASNSNTSALELDLPAWPKTEICLLKIWIQE